MNTIRIKDELIAELRAVIERVGNELQTAHTRTSNLERALSGVERECDEKDAKIERLKGEVRKGNKYQFNIANRLEKRVEKAEAELANVIAASKQALEPEEFDTVIGLSKIQDVESKYHGCKHYKGPPWKDGETKYGGFCDIKNHIQGGDFARLRLECHICLEHETKEHKP